MKSSDQPTCQPRRLVAAVGLAVGLSIMGDSFLYGSLPLEAEGLGIALPLVGVLLSVNRLVRLISNTWASGIFERFGPRVPFVLATIGALVTTSLYGAAWGFWVFFIARTGWGVAWSALRQAGYQAIWTGGESNRGSLMGLLWGIIRLGSAFGVLLGGFLRDVAGYQAGIWGLLILTGIAVPVAMSIPWPREAAGIPPSRSPLIQGWQEALKSPPARRLLAAGLTHSAFEGIVISTASLFLAHRLGNGDLSLPFAINIGTLAGLLLALRWTSDIIFAPVIGRLFDRLGERRTLILLVLLLMTGLGGLGWTRGPLLFPLLALLFVTSAGLNITLGALAGNLSVRMRRPHLFIGVFATGTDCGAALGPLIAYSLGVFLNFENAYLLFGIILAIAVFWFLRSGDNKSLQMTFL